MSVRLRSSHLTPPHLTFATPTTFYSGNTFRVSRAHSPIMSLWWNPRRFFFCSLVNADQESTQYYDGEATTPTVESTPNPVFNHAVELRLNDASSWERVCGPSAVLVFRVWRRSPCSWWGSSSPPAVTDQPSQGGAGKKAEGRPATSVPGSRFGDKLIGSAVVGLEVLRGAVDTRKKGMGLREIDGWYHVLDDLQRPQGQIKVGSSGIFPSLVRRRHFFFLQKIASLA